MEIIENYDHNSMRGTHVNQEEIANCDNNSSIQSWHHASSRIYRVSRATGGKDRHSKVYTSKGLKDRRIRLSVPTAIQFYDLQDRLGYDQPSKAIEWLINAAESAIHELPPLDTSNFVDRKVEHSHSNSINQLQQNSSTSDTSKGSVLSFSQSEIRAKDRENINSMDNNNTEVDPSLNSQGSFTKLLTRNNSIISPVINNRGDHQSTFLQDHFYREDYNLNFSISPFAGFHRGTLQSNSPSHHQNYSHNHNHNHHCHQYLESNAQTLSLALDGSSVPISVPVHVPISVPVHVPVPMPFFFGTALNGASSTGESQYASGIDGPLQHFEIDGKGKS